MKTKSQAVAEYRFQVLLKRLLIQQERVERDEARARLMEIASAIASEKAPLEFVIENL